MNVINQLKMIENFDTPFHEFASDRNRVLSLFEPLTNVKDYRLTITPTATGFTTTLTLHTPTDSEPHCQPQPRTPYLSDANTRTGPRTFPLCLSCDPDHATIAESNYQGGEALRGPPGGLPAHLRSLTTRSCKLDLSDSRIQPKLASTSAKSIRPDSAVTCTMKLEKMKASSASTTPPSTHSTVTTTISDTWLDAQGRPLIIVTPRDHVDAMADLHPDALCHVWATVARVLIRFSHPISSTDTDTQTPTNSFKKIVLNAGLYRNIAHTHVKIWFHPATFAANVDTPVLSHLLELRRLMKLPDREHLRKSLEYRVAQALPIRVLVKGEFERTEQVEKEICGKFAQFGKVSCVEFVHSNLAEKSKEGSTASDGRSICDGVVVVMASAEEAVEAVYALNLTRFGRNLSCKVKVLV
ncbi:hypothetical protein BJ741DRAFT_271837 [Chytriomyces cf. hyalinus JEL632]|nr:hypothetical protein BJ741DRAFT_271837 [Chytriomyces cf. hyalinus JEL632]